MPNVRWLTFSRWVQNPRLITRSAVNSAFRERGGSPLYKRVIAAANDVVCSDSKDLSRFKEECAALPNQQIASSIIHAFEDVLAAHEIHGYPGGIENYSVSLGNFVVPIKYHSVWMVDGNRAFMKYAFAHTPEYLASEEELKVHLALSALYVPREFKRLFAEGQGLLFEDLEQLRDPDELDWWALRFQGMSGGFVTVSEREVRTMSGRIREAAALVNEISEELSSFLAAAPAR